MKILVTGGTGLIGQKLLVRLFRDGHDLVLLSRNKKGASKALGLPCQIFECDLTQQVPGPEVFSGVEAVIHLAGESIATAYWSSVQKKKIYDSRVIGTDHLVQGMRQLGIRRPQLMLSASAIGFYGNRGDEVLTEIASLGKGFLAEVCRDWEAKANLASEAGVCRVINMRIGIVLASEGGALPKMSPLFSVGLGASLGMGNQWMSWVHIDDVIEAFSFVLKNKTIQGPVNVVAPQPVTNSHFTKILSSVFHKTSVLSAPTRVLKLALGEMSETILSSTRVLPVQLDLIGMQFSYSTLDRALSNIFSDYPNQSFEALQFIEKPISTIFQFFQDPKNLEKLTPPWLHFKIISQSSETIQSGTEIIYRIRVHGIDMTWKTLIHDFKPNESFADEQIKGPYSKWYHIHSFESLRMGTLVGDSVSYRLPLGGVGKIFAGRWVKKDIEKIFSFRKAEIIKLFGV